MKNPIILLLFLVSQTLLFGQTVAYQSSNNIIANPERGLQKYSITSNNYATTLGSNNLSVATLNSWKTGADKVTVVFRYFLLDAFLSSDINATFLSNIQSDFDHVRTAGLKIIVRFSYSDAEGVSAQQPTKNQILTHISQLSPILNANKDIIFSHQAGFIGTWGEWYYTNSTEFGSEDNISVTQWLNRKEIVDAMLAATPIEIPIQVRYPGIKMTLYGTTQLTEQTAYQNTTNARIGFFNDAFLNNYGDQGSFSVSTECENPVGTTDYNYLANETKYLPMTGETNGLNPCNSGFRTTAANALNELDLTNWTTINRDYHPDFWTQVIASNNYDDLIKNLGYRFVLDSSTVTSNNTNFDLTLDISNVGFARPFKERDVYLVIKNTATDAIVTELINTDIRTWETVTSITQNFDLATVGTFQLYLWIPDHEPLLATNSDYSIQFANMNTWESTTGYNNLLQTVERSILPIELSYFHTQLVDNNQVEISWKTETETNNDFFVVEKSFDGIQWHFLQEVQGAGTSIEPYSYLVYDPKPNHGYNYYRIKQVDFDGQFSYSPVRTVYFDFIKDSRIQVYPNPSREKLTIFLSQRHSDKIEIFNISGQKMSQYSLTKEDELTYNLNISNFPQGLYYIVIDQDVVEFVKK